ncbi:MAG: FimB/Mfa2 family fimbrial subunit [Muribaculaceae bacterium]|nr:FimB/Mfa2 family fimbrial subunit [Muribaculaceae bacterium]
MKHFFSNILARIIPALAAMAALSACDSLIYDYEGEDCDPVHIIRFEYDMNMKFADAFPAEVPSVDLYVFDKAGHLVTSVSRHVSREEAKDFSIELRGLAPGHYDLLAWCGVKDSEHFLVNHAGVIDPAYEHHTCRINSLDEGDANGHIRKDVGRLFHGRLDDVDMTADEGTYVHTVSLTKDTNVIRVVLQHLSGKPMDKADYDIFITDHNALYAHDNSLLPHKDITYHPWIVKSGEAAFGPDYEPILDDEQSRAQTSVSAVVAELTVGRLMADRKKDALLVVNNANDGSNIVTLPLIQYLLMVKGHYYGADGHTPMSDQEYLDREDDYPMTFFLDEQDHWLKTVIYINIWRVVLNESTLH